MRYTDLNLIAGGRNGMAFAYADLFIAFVVSGSHRESHSTISSQIPRKRMMALRLAGSGLRPYRFGANMAMK
jgi:hypothetical protein